ncbi:imidazole glycerol phosphate synthase subunit HisH [Sphingorhabdus buctiana]|uniref:Imidazole glycerol phosphate synthase subunit HisH n=1 Tax=Sphingorhabdus buctiana TaxID=1508805 RepID=A0ABW4MBL0_9SPHN
MTISIVDYGVGNLGSIKNMFKKLGASSRIVSNAEEISESKKLILPGVGAFDAGMRKLEQSGLRQALDQAVLERAIPVMGICLGMQLMTDGSEEGQIPGLGWIKGKATKFVSGDEKLKVPHMGWNRVDIVKNHPALRNLGPDSRFYFVHSFHIQCQNRDNVLMRTRYGSTLFDSGFAAGNIIGFQFHPEKSHRFGLALLKGFVDNF